MSRNPTLRLACLGSSVGRLAWIVAAAHLAAGPGCARIPVLNRFVKKPYYPYLDNPRFSFEFPRKWGPGVAIPGGVEFRHPKAPVSFSIAFYGAGDPGYRAPDAYRREMAAWGSVEDDHRVFQVEVSSRPAHQVRFTTYRYDPEYLLGQRVQVRSTEVLMAPDADGLLVVKYEAPKADFFKREFRKQYERFLRTLVLAVTKKEE